jgi:hypothetical protein
MVSSSPIAAEPGRHPQQARAPCEASNVGALKAQSSGAKSTPDRREFCLFPRQIA